MLNFSVSILVNTENSECKETNIAQLFICKGEKIANAGYFENIAYFVKAITCTKLNRLV